MTGRRIALCACGGVLSAHLLDAREAPQREVARPRASPRHGYEGR